ncbi:probable phospholipase A2 homolog 2 [Lolium perenne]|uniref:probable phospholipase A2 homolog 2 n=1 Tax=Lolium perenne TaxID=4522 RepID=UPI0021F567E5|nr:probable phospholipase A2 homolog 2 [Lolium perenne]
MRPFFSFSPWCSLLLLLLLATASQGLNVGDLLGQGKAPAGDKDCSRMCESMFCTVAPVLRYGKYCGILYSGCPGEKPCDALDACCMTHDHCVADHNNDYLNTMCNENLLNCLDRVNPAGPTFPGNKCGVGEVAFVIKGVIETAVLAGKILHKKDIGQ